MPRWRFDQNYLIVVATIALVTAPAALVTGYYLLSGDPRVRPLAASREAEALGERHRLGVGLVARVHWGQDSQAAFSRDELRQMIDGAFYAHGEEVRIEFAESSGHTVVVTYHIGHSHIGPFPVSKAASGVRAAVEVYRASIR